jgi:phosphatidylglycerophosphate synthase
MAPSPKSTPRLPAVIFCTEQTSDLRVAALTLLDRLVVTLHRASCGPIIIVSEKPVPELPRSRAWNIEPRISPETPALGGPVLVAVPALVVQAPDVQELIRQGGRLATAGGTSLSIGIVTGCSADSLAQLLALPPVAARGLAVSVNDPCSARAAERELWASLTSSSDGVVDRHFNRPVGRPLSKLLIHTSISPNTVSIASILIGLAAAGCFATGSYVLGIVGAVLFQISAIIDCVDGDIARAVFKESPLGKWLDLAGDQVVHVAVFGAVAAGLSAQGLAAAWWLGLSAIGGALLSFALVLRGMRRSDKPGTALQRLIDSATNRDFSVLVLALALWNELEVFLWLAAIGSHAFWIALLCLQRIGARTLRAGVPTTA